MRRGRANILAGTLPVALLDYIGTLKNFSAALMPLLHQDTSRGGGGSENLRSLAEFLGFESPPLAEPAAAAAINHRTNECAESEWRWAEQGSPEAAQTPRALVPPACFPPRHTNAFSSYSESAQPGALWPEESSTSSGEMTYLVASLKTLSVPSGSGSGAVARGPRGTRDACRRLERLDPWPDRLPAARDQRAAMLPRRASFCGVVSSGSNGGEVLRWGGNLPPRCSEAGAGAGYSAKVFLGGLPWDLTEQALMNALKHFQPIRVEWPGRECGAGAGGGVGGGAPRGYAYVTFESERRVRALLAASRRDQHDWYYRVGSRKMRSKEVQVIPWATVDSSWVAGGSARLEPARTVFVGALHGMLSASALATIMNDLFGGVVYAGIDTDKYKYPIGSGRVTFNNVRSYVRAISAAYVEIHTDKFTKKVQVNPYLEDSMCSVCNLQQGPYFCREPTCFGYFCRSCWSWQHSSDNHKPLMRNSKGGGGRAPSPRHSPTDTVYNGAFSGPNEGTPSPATSGASASDPEPGCGEGEASWPRAAARAISSTQHISPPHNAQHTNMLYSSTQHSAQGSAQLGSAQHSFAPYGSTQHSSASHSHHAHGQ